MKIDLDKKGMVHLVSGVYPSADIHCRLSEKNFGYEVGDSWYWNEQKLREMDDMQLYMLYRELRYYDYGA